MRRTFEEGSTDLEGPTRRVSIDDSRYYHFDVTLTALRCRPEDRVWIKWWLIHYQY